MSLKFGVETSGNDPLFHQRSARVGLTKLAGVIAAAVVVMVGALAISPSASASGGSVTGASLLLSSKSASARAW